MAWKALPQKRAVELLAVRGDVALELHLRPERLPAEDALAGLQSLLSGGMGGGGGQRVNMLGLTI